MEPQSSTDPNRPPEHAFGKIHEITVPIEWASTPKNPRRKVRGFAGGTTVTWSVNGVGFTAPSNAEVVVGSVLTLRIGPVDGEVVVRSTFPTEDSGVSYYGVEFIGDDLQAVARDLISIHLRHVPDDHRDATSPLDLVDPDQKHRRDWA